MSKRLAPLALFLLVALVTTVPVRAGVLSNLPVIPGRVTPVAPASDPRLLLPFAPAVIDMKALGVRPTARPAPLRASSRPLTGAVGAGSAYLDIAPDVTQASTASAFAILGSGFTAGETVTVNLNGGFAANLTANSAGRVAAAVNTGSGTGYITVELLGGTSSGHTGGIVQVAASASTPGLSVAPHALQPNGTNYLTFLGTRLPASTLLTVRRNGTFLGTVTTDGNGMVSFAFTPALSGVDTAAVYTLDAGTSGSMAGQSIEERADAGTGDQNVARSLVSRPVASSAAQSVAFAAEGFAPGDFVTVSGCGSAVLSVSASGVAIGVLSFGAGTGLVSCTFTGTGQVAYAAYLKDATALDAPTAFAAPSWLSGGGNLVVMVDRATPNDTGALTLDGSFLSGGPLSSGGWGGFTFPAPGGFVHAVQWAGSAGDVAAAGALTPVTLSGFDAE